MPATHRSAAVALAGALAAMSALAACGHSNPSPAVTVTVTPHASSSASGSAAPAAATPPAMVAVTKAGALVTLNPATGAITSALVARHVVGDEISVSRTGLVFFAVKRGCADEIEEIPVAGGNVTELAPGTLPAVSPDGTKLAYAEEPTSDAPGCIPNVPDIVTLYHLAIRALSSGATIRLPMVAPGQDSGLPAPISHLSWAADSAHLAVSISSAQDNEGWNLNLIDTLVAQYYLSGQGVTSVPVTGSSSHMSYLREGVYMPNGDLFVSRACCAGFPVHNTSRLMWEVSTAGVLIHQVAVGYVSLDHTSLDVSSDGGWLLYLAGNALYVSNGGATPRQLASGLIAAAWG
jgi:hypothetical protein